MREGIKTDLRTKVQVKKYLQEKNKAYRKIPRDLKKLFDKENLRNPYADTRILFGDPNREIKRIMVGIDIEVGELLLSEQLSRQGEEIDLIIAHHPEGIAFAGLDDVMHLQTDVLINLGIEEKVAKGLMTRRIKEVSRRLHSANHTRIVDTARLLNRTLMCCHTPSDNHVAGYLQAMMDKKKPKTLKHVIDLLMNEPEYRDAVVNRSGPVILVGKAKDPAGRIFVDMTGGTEGSKEIFARLSQAGIKTILGMHLSDAHFERIKSEYLNVIIAGHIASDNLGMNLLLDKLERRGKFEIIDCSGFRRIRRK